MNHGSKAITALTADMLNKMSSLRDLLATLVPKKAPTTPIGLAKKNMKQNKLSSISLGNGHAVTLRKTGPVELKPLSKR